MNSLELFNRVVGVVSESPELLGINTSEGEPILRISTDFSAKHPIFYVYDGFADEIVGEEFYFDPYNQEFYAQTELVINDEKRLVKVIYDSSEILEVILNDPRSV